MQFRISDLGMRDVVNIVDGSKLGPVKDVYIDPENGKIISLVLSSGKRRFFGLFSHFGLFPRRRSAAPFSLVEAGGAS